MVALHQVGQGDVAHHAVHRVLNLLPYLQGDAAIRPAAAAAAGHTAHRSQIALQLAENLAHGVLLGGTGQQIAAASAADAAHQAATGQLGDDLLQVFIGDLLRNLPAGWPDPASNEGHSGPWWKFSYQKLLFSGTYNYITTGLVGFQAKNP